MTEDWIEAIRSETEVSGPADERVSAIESASDRRDATDHGAYDEHEAQDEVVVEFFYRRIHEMFHDSITLPYSCFCVLSSKHRLYMGQERRWCSGVMYAI